MAISEHIALLKLWSDMRNATELRGYWFLFAQVTTLGFVVANLKNLSESAEKSPNVTAGVIAALGFASAMATVASIAAYASDLPRLDAVRDLLPLDKDTFTTSWGHWALVGPFGFGVFYYCLAGFFAPSRWGKLSVFGAALATVIVAVLMLGCEIISVLRDRPYGSVAPRAAAVAPPGPSLSPNPAAVAP